MPADRIIPPPPRPAVPDHCGQGGAANRMTGAANRLAGWEALMREALAEARKALERGEVPVGAVVVDASGLVIGRGFNTPVSANDPSAHAEINALRRAAERTRNYRLNGACLIATLEPCLMCAGAAVHARVAGVVYGARDQTAGAAESCLEALDLPQHNHRPWHLGGILEDECAALLNEFFAGRRRGAHFPTQKLEKT